MISENKPTEEQNRYANVLHFLAMAGLGYLILTFLIYVTGILPGTMEAGRLPEFWQLPSHDYIQATHAHTGWSWIKNIGYGNILSFSSLIYLSTVSIIAFFTIIPIYIKKKDWYYLAIAVLQILVLVLAAGGWLTGGH